MDKKIYSLLDNNFAHRKHGHWAVIFPSKKFFNNIMNLKKKNTGDQRNSKKQKETQGFSQIRNVHWLAYVNNNGGFSICETIFSAWTFNTSSETFSHKTKSESNSITRQNAW